MNEEEYREHLAGQLARNRVSWKRLLESGYSEGTLAKLDFFFYAPDEEKANELAEFIAGETDYEVKAAFEDIEWSVSGTTGEAVISPELLDAWVEWMAGAGRRFDSQFDGWEAKIA